MRFLLGTALLISLWPVGAAVAVGAHWNDEPERRASSGTSSGSAGEAIVSVARKELRPIVASVRHVNGEFQNSDIAEGTPQPEFATKAKSLVKKLKNWSAFYDLEVSHAERRTVNLLIALMQSMEDLASSPTEENFDAYNAAISEFDQFVRSAGSG